MAVDVGSADAVVSNAAQVAASAIKRALGERGVLDVKTEEIHVLVVLLLTYAVVDLIINMKDFTSATLDTAGWIGSGGRNNNAGSDGQEDRCYCVHFLLQSIAEEKTYFFS